MKDTQFNCDEKCVQCTIDVFGDKWTPLMVMQLSDGPKKFSEFETALSGISPRTLSQRLDFLLCEKIIDKSKYQNSPDRYHYSLTKKGTDLQQILKSMEAWGSKYGSNN